MTSIVGVEFTGRKLEELAQKWGVEVLWVDDLVDPEKKKRRKSLEELHG